jgi:hypothetical protein
LMRKFPLNIRNGSETNPVSLRFALKRKKFSSETGAPYYQCSPLPIGTNDLLLTIANQRQRFSGLVPLTRAVFKAARLETRYW